MTMRKGGRPVWKGFDTALLDDGMITWSGIGEYLCTGRTLLGILSGAAGLTLALHFLL